MTGFPNVSVHNKDGTVPGVSVTQDPELSHGLSAHGLPALAVAQVDSTGPVIQGQGGGTLLTLRNASAAEQFKVDSSGNVTAAGTVTAAAVSSSFAANTTPTADTVTETSVASFTIPAGNAAVGSVYEMWAFGGLVWDNSATDTIQIRAYAGTLGGTLLLDTGAFEPALNEALSATARAFELRVRLVCSAAGGSGSYLGHLFWGTPYLVNGLGGGTQGTGIAGAYTASPVTVATNVSKLIVVSVQFGTANAGDSLTCAGGYAQKAA